MFKFLVFISLILSVKSFTPPSKEEQLEKFHKLDQEVEPLRKNITECARQVRAKNADIENFMKRVPQTTLPGKCFVACILKKNSLIVNNKVSAENLLRNNAEVYGEDSEVQARMKIAIEECSKVVNQIFEICEYASTFHDCMHLKMDHIMDKVMMERRMQALGQMSDEPDDEEWNPDDEVLQLMKDEL